MNQIRVVICLQLLLLLAIQAVASGKNWSAASDYYRSSVAGGSWANASSWQSSPDNATWSAATSAPNDLAAGILIRNGFNITSGANVTADDITVEAGASLSITAGTFTLNNGAAATDLQLNGTLTVSGGSLAASGTGITVAASGVYNHGVNGGTIPTASWNAASNCNVTGMTGSFPSGMGQAFGNFTWNCAGQTIFFPVNDPAFSTAGTLTVSASGSSSGLNLNNSATSMSYSLGAINITGGILELSYLPATGPIGLTRVKVAGDVSVTSPGQLELGFNIGTATPVTGGVYASILEIGGNLAVGAGAKFHNSGDNYSAVLFSKTGSALYTNPNSATVDYNYGVDYLVSPVTSLSLGSNMSLDGSYEGRLFVAGTMSFTAGFVVNDAGTGSPAYSDFYLLGNGSTSATASASNGSNILTGLSSLSGIELGMAVTGSNLPANTYVVDYSSSAPYQLILNNSATGSGASSYTISSAGKLISSATNGISSLPLTNGSVQSRNYREYSSTADYEFQGANTGDFPASTAPSLNTVRNLTINRAAGVNLGASGSGSSLKVTGALNLQAGTFKVPTATTLTIAGTIPSPAGNIDATGASSTVQFDISGYTINSSLFTPAGNPSILVNNPGIGTNNLSGNFIIARTLNLASGILDNGNNTLTLGTGGSVQPIVRTTGTLTLGTNASLVFNSAGSGATIPDNAFTAAPVIANLTANRSQLVTWNNQGLQLAGALTLTSGTFNIGNGLLDLNGASLGYTTGLISGSANSDLTVRGNTGGTVLLPLGGNIALRTVSVSGTRILQMNGSNNINLYNSMTIASGATYDNGGESQIAIGAGSPTISISGKFITRDQQGFQRSAGGAAITNGIASTVNAGSTIEYGRSGDQEVQGSTVSYANLTLSGSGTKLLVSGTNPNGLVYITGTAIMDAGSFGFGNTTTNLTMDGSSRFRMSGTGSKPDIDGVYTLNAGVIEFYNSGTASNQTVKGISTGSNPILYKEIEITGNKVANSNSNITLGDAGKFTVKSNGIFEINDDAIVGPGYPNQSVVVENGGTFRTGDIHGFSGGTGATATSVRSDVETVDLQPGSTVEYWRGAPNFANGDQVISNTHTYQNLTLSGTGNKNAPGGVLNVNGNLTGAGTATFVHNYGTVALGGSAAQNYSSSTAFNFYKLTNNNTVGTNISNDLSITRELTLGAAAILNVGAGNITIKSAIDSTARIAAIPSNASVNYTGAGRFVIERFIQTTRKWQLLAAPISSASTETVHQDWQENQAAGATSLTTYGSHVTGPSGTGLDFTTPGYSMKFWPTPNLSSDYTPVTNTGNALSNQWGYFLFVRGDRTATPSNSTANTTTLRTTGKINVGTQTIALNPTTAGDFASVANPYASAIDLRTVKIASSNITSTIAVWDPKLTTGYGLGAYQYLTLSGSDFVVGAPAGGSYGAANTVHNYIESGQAFFVQTTSTSASVQFKESDKGVSTIPVFFTSGRQQQLSTSLSVIRNGQPVLVDGSLAIFGNQYSNDANYDDALKIANTGESAGFRNSGKVLAIERRRIIRNADTLWLNIDKVKINTYEWRLNADNLDANGRKGWLVDGYLHKSTELDLSGATAYRFSIENIPGSYAANRFYILFQQAKLRPVEILAEAMRQDKAVVIKWNVQNEQEIEGYSIEHSQDGNHFETIGRKDPDDNNGGNISYTLADNDPFKGINYYRIRMIDFDGLVTYSNIVKLLPVKNSGISVYPNPVTGKLLQVQFSDQAAGSYAVELRGLNGQLVYQGTLKVNERYQQFKIKLPGSLAAGSYQLTATRIGEKPLTTTVLVQ